MSPVPSTEEPEDGFGPLHPGGLCDLCEKTPAEPGDCFCVQCRIEVSAMLVTVNSPVERVLSQHWKMEPLSSNESTLCRCGERFDGGPGFHRRHLAEKIHEALGLDPPLPWTDCALEVGDD